MSGLDGPISSNNLGLINSRTVNGFPLSEDFDTNDTLSDSLDSSALLARKDPELTDLRENKFKSMSVSMTMLVFTLFLGFLPTATCLAWLLFPNYDGNFHSGLAWDWSTSDNQWKTLNWHPLLMVFAFGTCFNLASVSYRVFPLPHLHKKYIHLALQTFALISSTIAVVSAFLFKKFSGNDNLYTAHSQFGALLYILFVAQYLIGYASFAYPSPSEPSMSLRRRMSVVSWHSLVGFMLLAGTTAVICSGVQDRQYFYDKYQLPAFPGDVPTFYRPGFLLANAVGFATLISVGLVQLHHRRRSARVVGRVGDRQTVAYDDVDFHSTTATSPRLPNRQNSSYF